MARHPTRPAPQPSPTVTEVPVAAPTPIAPAIAAAILQGGGVAGLAWWAVGSHPPGSTRVALALVVGVAVAALSARARHEVRRSRRVAAALLTELDGARAQRDVDPVTGLIGRRALLAEVDQRLGSGPDDGLVAVLSCDLDRLRLINDALGPAAGDEVVRLAARRLAGVVRGADVLGRVAGDRFVVVSSGLPTVRDLEILAGRLIEALARPTALADGAAPVVSCSVGIAVDRGARDRSPLDLMRAADSALHHAKAQGGGRYEVYDPALRAAAEARLELEQQLRLALRTDELRVHYQPLVDVVSGRVEQLEALVRWEHPRRGTILPGEFLPVASQSGLIADIGERVLLEACTQAARWTDRLGRPISVAVNVAEDQLRDGVLVDTVTRALARSGLPAAQLELEVSEDLLLARLEKAAVVLRQLELLGVRVAIDDFGTSQASLGRLKELTMVSTLKIDRVFVADLGRAPGGRIDRDIVAAIVALASSLGMNIVAEGVETPHQAQVLVDLGVERLQGFLFARPGSAGAVEESLRLDHRPRLAAVG